MEWLVIIFNPSISRPDCNFECIGHMAENIMTAVLGKRFNDYSPNQYKVTDLSDLNLWERFILNDYSAPGYAGVGNIHLN